MKGFVLVFGLGLFTVVAGFDPLLLVAQEAPAPEFKPGIPGLKMADVREHKHLWREIEELQTWERGDRISIAEFRGRVIEKTAGFLGFDEAASAQFTATARHEVANVRRSFQAARASDVDPSDPRSPFGAELEGCVERLRATLRQEPRHQLFAPDFEKWLLRLAFGPSEAKEAREAAAADPEPSGTAPPPPA